MGMSLYGKGVVEIGLLKNLVNPGWNGMTYTLHFPPIADAEGKPFINSSPRLFPPK